MGNSAPAATYPQNLDLSLEMVLAVDGMTSEAGDFMTVRTPTPRECSAPVIFEPRKAIVFCRTVE